MMKEKIINFRKIVNLLFVVVFLCLSAISIFAQTETLPKPNVPQKPKDWKVGKVVQNKSGTPAEKSIAVDANVNISLCVSEGNLKINGWERNEIRAFVNNGSEAGFKVLEKNKQGNSAVWVKVLGFDPTKNKETNPDECLFGEEIELDVPRGATVKVKGQTSETRIESVGKVSVEIGGGDIFLSGIERGVDAKVYEGDVTV
ncbi:MAG: hypothetical protein M3388_11320, partial [Acidobacteriota bacterium]|nr:hypothetical protein [Acidobacteriota bacterium]